MGNNCFGEIFSFVLFLFQFLKVFFVFLFGVVKLAFLVKYFFCETEFCKVVSFGKKKYKKNGYEKLVGTFCKQKKVFIKKN